MEPLCYRHRNGYISAFPQLIYLFRKGLPFLYRITAFGRFFRSRRFSPSPLINLSFRLLAAFQKIDNCIACQIFLYLSGCSVEIIVSFRLFCIRIRIRLLSQLLLRSSPRPISIGQLHALLRFHLRPINLVVFKGSYYLTIWDILS